MNLKIALLQVDAALERVRIIGASHQLIERQERGASLHRVGSKERKADRRPRNADVRVDLRRRTEGVPHGRRAKEGQHEKRPGVQLPLEEIVKDTLIYRPDTMPCPTE